MNVPHLPFKILGQISPILAWTEGEHGRLPATWKTEAVPFRERERDWLLQELPNYSYDNIQEIVEGSRSEHHDRRFGEPTRLPFPVHKRWLTLSPTSNYNLLEAFRRLNQYFFVWNGTEPCIRENRMEELHELAIRMPAGHIVRHGHARAVSEGVLSFEEALELPELPTLLPSNSFGLRSIVRQGLSESHLHLKGVISAEETWADNLLRSLSDRAVRGETPQERRLLTLNLFAGRILALAVWFSLIDPEEELFIRPRQLLMLLDAVYFARTSHEAYQFTLELDKEIRRAVYGPPEEEPWSPQACEHAQLRDALREQHHRRDSGELEKMEPWSRVRQRGALVDHKVPGQYSFLLRWMAPTAFRLLALKRGDALPGGLPEGPELRYRFVQQLHLAAHLRLVQETSKRFRDAPAKRIKEGEKKRLPPGPRRYFLHEALFRYLVCRTHHWQRATQQGKTTGLRYFKEFYGSRQRRLSGVSRLQNAELTFQRLRQWRGLRILEGRVAPPEKIHDLVPWILAYARPEDRRIQKFGMVVHFKKEDENKEDRGFSRKIPQPIPRLRWGRRRRMIRAEGMRLYRFLQRPTPVTPFVVGIDAANLELSTPPEVFAPVFRFMRELPIPLSGHNRRYTPYFALEPSIRELVVNRRLGMTYHVGEDFRHLLSGLRAINEVVEFLAPHPGDRLGHGTALALQPEDWLEHNGYQAVVPKLEWLDTLVWVHHFLGPGDDVVGELAIEDQIQRRSWEIYAGAMKADYDPLGLDLPLEEREKRPRLRGLFDWDWSPLTLWDAWMLRQLDPYSLNLPMLFKGELSLKPLRGSCEEERRWHSVQERVMREAREQVGSRNAYLLLALYWLSPKVREEGEEIVVVDMQAKRDSWLELCRRVEEKMKRIIYEKELVIEVNPSANRIIGPMERFGQHHVFHLTLDEDRRLKREVRVSVNTDNPAVCHTTLAHEHYLLGEILMKQGVPEAEVVKWLEWLRKNGEEYNFVRRLKSPKDNFYMEKLIGWLRGIRPSVLEAQSRDAKHGAFWTWLRETRLRDRGFTKEAISSDLGTLDRIVALEDRLAALRSSVIRGSRMPEDVQLRLDALQEELDRLKHVTVM